VRASGLTALHALNTHRLAATNNARSHDLFLLSGSGYASDTPAADSQRSIASPKPQIPDPFMRLSAALRLRAHSRCPSRAIAAASAAAASRPPTARHRRRAATATMATSSSSSFPVAGIFFLDDFAARQWDDPNYSGTRVPPGSLSKQAFTQAVADAHAGRSGSGGNNPSPSPLVDGYAPFCKHVFVENVLGASVGCLPITDANRALLRSGYTRRRPEELPVLTRWFREADVAPLPEAKWLDVILYSREQLEKEYAAMPTKKKSGDGSGGDGASENAGLQALRALPADCQWGIISVKAQDESFETPMQPITMLRNALGREEGGSGVPIDRQAYEASAAYWDGHAAVVASESPSGE